MKKKKSDLHQSPNRWVDAKDLYDLADALHTMAGIAATHPDRVDESPIAVVMDEILHYAARAPQLSAEATARRMGLPPGLVANVINARIRRRLDARADPATSDGLGAGVDRIEAIIGMLIDDLLRRPPDTATTDRPADGRTEP